eukprot:scaffold895_cov315-Pinguiococcus_pyrenoidosus.AAC.19
MAVLTRAFEVVRTPLPALWGLRGSLAPSPSPRSREKPAGRRKREAKRPAHRHKSDGDQEPAQSDLKERVLGATSTSHRSRPLRGPRPDRWGHPKPPTPEGVNTPENAAEKEREDEYFSLEMTGERESRGWRVESAFERSGHPPIGENRWCAKASRTRVACFRAEGVKLQKSASDRSGEKSVVRRDHRARITRERRGQQAVSSPSRRLTQLRRSLCLFSQMHGRDRPYGGFYADSEQGRQHQPPPQQQQQHQQQQQQQQQQQHSYYPAQPPQQEVRSDSWEASSRYGAASYGEPVQANPYGFGRMAPPFEPGQAPPFPALPPTAPPQALEQPGRRSLPGAVDFQGSMPNRMAPFPSHPSGLEYPARQAPIRGGRDETPAMNERSRQRPWDVYGSERELGTSRQPMGIVGPLPPDDVSFRQNLGDSSLASCGTRRRAPCGPYHSWAPGNGA